MNKKYDVSFFNKVNKLTVGKLLYKMTKTITGHIISATKIYYYNLRA